MNNDRTIVGRPSKAFFVDMITRDLTVEDSILDLIDNAIDEAVTQQGVNVTRVLTGQGEEGPRFSNAKVSIKLGDGEFLIQDTCGGISIEEAQKTVFRFGNPEPRPLTGGLGVYGIGMKRSFFKLGREIVVKSTTEHERFLIEIDVDEWTERGDEDWNFSFENTERLKEPPDVAGTEITITQLTEAARRRFESPGFLNDLVQRIESTYALFVEAGLEIEVNGDRAVSKLPTNVTADYQITPARREFHVGAVEVLIVAGVSPRRDRRRHGWYIFCNGRIVLDADKTEVTGWGVGLQKWHTKFGHFVGYAYFRSDDVRKLPWRTTKQGVVTDSAVYQKALAEMNVQARPVLNFLTRLYPGEVEAEGVHEREVMRKAKAVSVTELPLDDTPFEVRLPKPKKDPATDTVSIQYSKTKGDIDRIRRCVRLLSNASARKVGEYAFDYLKKQECSE